jgi:hypothetical protein
MDPLPIACTIGFAAFTDRWHTVLVDGLISTDRRRDGVRLLVSPGVEQAIRGLLALEAECCTWFSGAVTPGDPVIVDLITAGDGPAVLEAMIEAAIAGHAAHTEDRRQGRDPEDG